jgi:hypothetical protein
VLLGCATDVAAKDQHQPTLSVDAAQAAAQLIRSGEHWQQALDGRAISYGFRASAGTTNDAAGHNEETTFSRMSPEQIGAVTLALSLWSDVADIRFEAADSMGYTNDASMLFANDNDPGDGAGAFAPGASLDGGAFDKAFDKADGDVWIDLHSHNAADVAYGGFHFWTILHEIGHAIGLSHPGDYNAGPGETITYEDDAEYIQDSRQYTVMSYFDESKTGADTQDNFPIAPLLHDIAAVQALYGANTLTRGMNTYIGVCLMDTTATWAATLGRHEECLTTEGAAAAQLRRLGITRPPDPRRAAWIQRARDAVGPAAAADMEQRGAALGYAAALARAVQLVGDGVSGAETSLSASSSA